MRYDKIDHAMRYQCVRKRRGAGVRAGCVCAEGVLPGLILEYYLVFESVFFSE